MSNNEHLQKRMLHIGKSVPLHFHCWLTILFCFVRKTRLELRLLSGKKKNSEKQI